MAKLTKHFRTLLTIILVSAFILNLGSCNNSSKKKKETVQKADTTTVDTTGKGEQVPPPK